MERRRSGRLKRNLELPPPKDCVDVNEDDDDDEDIEEEPPAASRDLNTPSPPSEQDLNPFFHDDPNFDAYTPEDVILKNGDIFAYCRKITTEKTDVQNISLEVSSGCYFDHTEFDEAEANAQVSKIGDNVSKLILRCIGWNSMQHGPIENQFKLFGIFLEHCKNIEQLSITINDSVVMNPDYIQHLKLQTSQVLRRPNVKILQYGLNGPYGPANFLPLLRSCPRVQQIHFGCNSTIGDCRAMEAAFPNVFERVVSLSMYNYEVVKYVAPRNLFRLSGLFICPPYKMKLWKRILNKFADQLVHLSVQLGILYGTRNQNPVQVTLPVMKNLKTLDFDYTQMDESSPVHAVCHFWRPDASRREFPNLQEFWMRLNRATYKRARRDKGGHLSIPEVVYSLLALVPPKGPYPKFPNVRRFQMYIDGKDIILVTKRPDLQRLQDQMKRVFPRLEFPSLAQT